jgi:hypothetical protein
MRDAGLTFGTCLKHAILFRKFLKIGELGHIVHISLSYFIGGTVLFKGRKKISFGL